MQRALAIRQKLLPRAHRHLATANANVGETLQRLGRHEAALPYVRESAEIFALVEGEDSEEHGQLLVSVGSSLAALGRFDQAEPVLERGVAILRSALPQHSQARVRGELELAALHEARGDYDKALALCEDILARADVTKLSRRVRAQVEDRIAALQSRVAGSSSAP
jgi:tetratricopeptide (TPR) repeat protein